MVFIEIDSARRVISEVQLGIAFGRPICLEGSIGVGKSCLIEEIAHRHQKTLLRLNVGEQTDAKLLLGCLVSTEIPGEFEYREGVLASALREGHWLVIEDFHLSGHELLGMIQAIYEEGKLSLPNSAKTLHRHPGLVIFATTSRPLSPSHHLTRRWTRVRVNEPTDEELYQILKGLFASLEYLLPLLIQSFRTIRERIDFCRVLSLRDLIKVCHRLALLLGGNGWRNQQGAQPQCATAISVAIREALLHGMLDVFCGPLPTLTRRVALTEALAEVCGLSREGACFRLLSYRPDLRDMESCLSIGSSPPLPKLPPVGSGAPHQLFIHTGLVLRNLERLATAIHLKEAVLLVGETGTGKTSIVQSLAGLLRAPLHVVNLHRGTEDSDLLGGYRPCTMSHAMAQLKDRFEALFKESF